MKKLPPKQASLVKALRGTTAPKPGQMLPATPKSQMGKVSALRAVLAENGEK